jgi:hypothetical protein
VCNLQVEKVLTDTSGGSTLIRKKISLEIDLFKVSTLV